MQLNQPECWAEDNLDNLATFIDYRGKTPVKTNTGAPLITAKNIKDGYINREPREFIALSDYDSWMTRGIPKVGDVLITTEAPMGNVALVDISEVFALAQRAICLQFFYDQMSNYAHYALRSPVFQRALTANSTGTTVSGIKASTLKMLRLPIPPLAEQKVIADKLDTLLAQVETTKARLERIPKILKSFRQSVLTAAVTGKLTEEWRFITKSSLTLESFNKSLSYFRAKAKGLDRISENGSWISCQLGHVISVKSGDGLTAKDMAPEGYIPVYGGNGINGYHDKSNVSDSVIAIGRVGFYCGSVHLTEKQAWITDNALIVDFSEQLFSKDFLYFLLRATNLREDSASTAQPVISGAKIYPIAVQIPPFEEQTEIVRRVEQLFVFADSIEQKANAALARVNNLTQSLLAKAFRGELTADWRTANPELITGDNSAEALLAKIKAERAKVKARKKN